MKARSLLGILMVITGFACIVASLYNFNEFFFRKGWSTWERVVSALPLYALYVATPMLLGMLLFIDGRIVYRLRRKWTLSIHFVSNLMWLYGIKLLYDLMSQPITEARRYQEVFYLIVASLTLFLIGVAIDSIRLSKKMEQIKKGEPPALS